MLGTNPRQGERGYGLSLYPQAMLDVHDEMVCRERRVA